MTGVFFKMKQKSFLFHQGWSEINLGAKIFQKNQIYSKNDETTQSVAAQWIEWFLACCPRNSFFTKTDKNCKVEPNPKPLWDKAFTDWPQTIAWEFWPPNRKILKIQIIGKKSKGWSLLIFKQKVWFFILSPKYQTKTAFIRWIAPILCGRISCRGCYTVELNQMGTIVHVSPPSSS